MWGFVWHEESRQISPTIVSNTVADRASVYPSHNAAASLRLSAVGLVRMYNSACTSLRCQNVEAIPHDFHFRFLKNGRLVGRAPDRRGANFTPPEKNEPWKHTEGQSNISKRKTKIMIALTCSWGAVCSLQRSREVGVQWPFTLHAANKLEGEQRTQNKYESKFWLSEACMLAALHTNIHSNMGEKRAWDFVLTLCLIYYLFSQCNALFLHECTSIFRALSFFISLPPWHFHLNGSLFTSACDSSSSQK